MASRYKTRHGIDYWPAEMADLNIDLVYGKKWRELERRGHEIRDPWVPYLSALKTIYGDAFKVSPWTEAHVRNWVMHEKPIFWGSASCGKAVLLDEPVFFPDRVGTMREVEVGSEIVAATGGRVRVTGVYDHVDEELYRVGFADGTETVCSAEHLWTVYEDEKSDELVTADARALAERSLRHPLSVPLVRPVDFEPLQCRDPFAAGCEVGREDRDDVRCPEILDPYKFNRADVRLEFLRGYRAAQGDVTNKGVLLLRVRHAGLAADLRFIAESLGGYVVAEARGPYDPNGSAFVLHVHGLPSDVLSLLSMRRQCFTWRRPVGRKAVTYFARVERREDWPRETRCITIAPFDESGRPTDGLFPIGHFTVTHNSNDVAACLVPDWFVDPYTTITLVGSTTKDALRIRVWEAIERYFAVAKQYARSNGMVLPGKVTQTGYAVLNDRAEDDDPNAQGGKAGIHGVALNEGGKLQGAHLPYVRIVIDELATINDHQAILDTVSNLVVAEDFKFVAMANPEPWSTPSSSIYCTPVDGISSVSVDTREWDSTFGAHVLHDDGEKSPCVLDPSLEKEFPFLTRRKHLAEALRIGGGNPNAPSYWKMARGFPTPVATGSPTVLDPAVAVNMKVQEPGPPFSPADWRGTCAGVDPAWTEGGDDACRARCWVRVDAYGRPYLDFTGGLRRLSIDATDAAHPAVEQMRNQCIAIARSSPYEAPFRNTAVDASGNQGLADDLFIYAGAECLAVNSSQRASETPMRANVKDGRLAKDVVYDRGTESWCVLAEFCKAGMVRGLPPEAVRALTTRRFATRVDRKTGIVLGQQTPLRLESKADFARTASRDGKAGGGFGASPNECDACALAALAAKERFGLMPFGFLAAPVADLSSPPSDAPGLRPKPAEDYGAPFDDGDRCCEDPPV